MSYLSYNLGNYLSYDYIYDRYNPYRVYNDLNFNPYNSNLYKHPYKDYYYYKNYKYNHNNCYKYDRYSYDRNYY
jgi:hypothetical protein